MRFNNRPVARVVFDRVSKSYRGPKGESIRALEDASFTVEDKELLVLVGPSGCGKTTTLRLLAGLEEISSGTIAIDGRVVNDVPPKDRDIAMVFQNHALYPHMSVFENLAFGLAVRKLSRGEIERRVKEAAEILGLESCLARRPQELSGGQRQRVAVGRAIVLRPRLFLFDEPLSNLDLQMRAQLRTELARLHQRLEATMIYVTHDQVEAMTLGDRIAVLREGKIQQIADPLQLYREPANLFVAGFIGSPPMNFFKGTIAGTGDNLFFEQAVRAAASTAPLRLPLEKSSVASVSSYISKQIVLGLRPEDMCVSPGSNPAPGSAVAAVVEIIEPLGSETHLHFNCGGAPFIVRALPSTRASVNQGVALSFDMSKARFFDAGTGNAIA